MRLLIVGGTVFLGRALVDAARARGHEVTLFNRGKQNPDLFPELERLRGDRATDLAALSGRAWDALIDTCGYIPAIVEKSATYLQRVVSHYTFISSVSVYADFASSGIDETYPVGVIPEEAIRAATGNEHVSGENYGPLKALCEQAVECAMPGRALIIRPGLIVGPFDPSDRFTYWPARVRRGGHILAPVGPQSRVQIIDVRDLAEWTVRMIEQRATGVYNATGAEPPLTFGQLLTESKRLVGSDSEVVWVPDDFLMDNNVGAYVELPLWVPREGNAGFDSVSIRKAIADGLTFRPLSSTIRDTLAWDHTRPPDEPRRAGLTPEREAKLLRKWRDMHQATPAHD